MPAGPRDKGESSSSRPNTRKGIGTVPTPEELQDIKSAIEGRKFLEKHALLAPPGEPVNNATMAVCLHQISALSGVPKQAVNAIRAAAFLLEEIEELAINETVRDAFDSQITEFTSDMKLLVDDVNTKIDSHLQMALEQIAKASEKATTRSQVNNERPQDRNSVPPPQATYASALIIPPPYADPKLAAKEGIKARQVLITGIKDSALGQHDTQQLKAELNKLLRGLGQKEGKIKSVIIQRDGNTLVEVDSDALAIWFANKVNRVEFSSMIGDEVSFKTRLFKVIAYNAPLNLDTRDANHQDEIHEANGLEEDTIKEFRWAKPLDRRSPNQRSAHLILSYTDPEAANRAISNGITICNKRCHVERVKKEPIRCLRCQGWNHMARECPEPHSTCGNCGEEHKTAECTHPRRTRCVSCKTNDHASWSRECPSLLRRTGDYNERNPENLLPFFPTSDPWTWSRGDANNALRPNRQSAPKKADPKGKQNSYRPQEPQRGDNRIAMNYIAATNTHSTVFGVDMGDKWWGLEDPPGPSINPTQTTQPGTSNSHANNITTGANASQNSNHNTTQDPNLATASDA
jgi:hypothetical protein